MTSYFFHLYYPILYINVSGVPLTINIFKTAVSITKNSTGFNPLKMNLGGILAIIIIIIKNATTTVYPTNLFIKKRHTINNNEIKIFVLGSSLCIKDSPGKYCPIVISFNIPYSPPLILLSFNIDNNCFLASSIVNISSLKLNPLFLNSLAKYVTCGTPNPIFSNISISLKTSEGFP